MGVIQQVGGTAKKTQRVSRLRQMRELFADPNGARRWQGVAICGGDPPKLTTAHQDQVVTTTAADPDSHTWTISGFDACDAVGCHNAAIIIANDADHDRFCETHLDMAARVALSYKRFPGWYRVTGARTVHGQLVIDARPL